MKLAIMTQKAPLEALQIADKVISKPIRGKVVSLEAVPDPVFSRKIIGDGVAIIPEEGKVFAPFDGTVESLMSSSHALGLKSQDGIELLIHIGLDTIHLEGEGFLPRIKEGETFEAGELLLEFDLDFLKRQGCNVITPVIFTN